MRMMANPVRDSARIGLARQWRRGGAAFGRAKAPATRLASFCLPVPAASAPPSENAENKKKTCQCEGLWFCGQVRLWTFDHPPVCTGRA